MGTSDPTGHRLYEIDPEIDGGACGAICSHFIPLGTKVCVECTQVYPMVFECCPKLVDLALAAFGHPTPDWGPKTQERIVEFLNANPVVVENTIKLRLLEACGGDLDSEVAQQIVYYVKSIGSPLANSKLLLDWVEYSEIDSDIEPESDN